MAARAALAAAASSISRSSARAPAARLVPSRSLAGGGDHHESPKVNFWEEPRSPAKWKEEHIVILSLSGWGLLIYGGFKLFGGKKKEAGEKSGH